MYHHMNPEKRQQKSHNKEKETRNIKIFETKHISIMNMSYKQIMEHHQRWQHGSSETGQPTPFSTLTTVTPGTNEWNKKARDYLVI